MRTRDVVRHARRTARLDIERISENRAELMRGARHLRKVRGDIEDYLPLDDPGSFRIHPWAPRPGAMLFNTALREMREQMAKPAASRLKFTSDVLARLAGIVPQIPAGEGSWSRSHTAACGMAEPWFMGALHQVKNLQLRGQNRVSTYHDEAGNPLLFRKSNYEGSAISLAAIAIGEDAVIPAGTILGLGDNMNRHQTGDYKGDGFKLASFAVPQVMQITPIRLSAWAFDNPADRAVFGLPRGRVDSMRAVSQRTQGERFEHTRLGDFSEASQAIMQLCAEPNANA